MENDIRRCEVCDDIIPEGRIEVLPEVTTCVKHSKVTKKKVGFMVFGHKTGGVCEVVDPNKDESEETLRQAWRAHRRSR